MTPVRTLALVTLLFLLPNACFADDGTLYVEPAFASHVVGESFEARVLVATGGSDINATEAEISFNPQSLEVERISTDGSILASFATPPRFSNENGTIKFTGWTKSPYNGEHGLLITVVFKALRNITSNVQLTAGAILASGGGESNIITSMRSEVVSIAPKELPRVDAHSIDIEEATSSPATTSPQIPPPVTLPPSPQFTEYSANFSAGDRIILKGTAPPNAKLALWLAKGGALPEVSSVYADPEGTFTYVSDEKAQAGEYHLWATTEAGGAESDRSQKVDIVVTDAPLLASAESVSNVLGGLLPYISILFLLGLLGGYVRYRLKR
jgi:hypothetical protein